VDPEGVARGRMEAPGVEAERRRRESSRVERRRSEDRGAEGWGVRRGCPFPTGVEAVPPS